MKQEHNARGHFGPYGGQYVAETLMPLILKVADAYEKATKDPSFQEEIDYYQYCKKGRSGN